MSSAESEIVTVICPPDPAYGAECAESPFDWVIVTKTVEAIEGVISPDFGLIELRRLPKDLLMGKDVTIDEVSKSDIENFIRAKYLLFFGIDKMGEEGLRSLSDLVKFSELYVSSRKAKKEYVAQLIENTPANLRLLDDHYAIFVSSFLDQTLLSPINVRLKEIVMAEIGKRKTA